jgi:hypothetical protein
MSYYYKEGYLHLDYPNIQNITDDNEEGWNLSISEMNKIFNVYDKCDKMYLCTDFYYRFPKIFLNFKKLKHLTLDGTRWFYVDCEQLPNTLEYLDIDSININPGFAKGMDRLINLHTICIDFSRFFGNDWFVINLYKNYEDDIIFDIGDDIDEIEPFYNLQSLQKIVFHIGTSLYEEETKINLNMLSKHKIFDNIRHRIKEIYIEHDIVSINNVVIKLSKDEKN